MNTQTTNLISFAMDKAMEYAGRLELQETIRAKKEMLRQLQEALLPELMWQNATDWSFGEVNERLSRLSKQGWELDGVVEESQVENEEAGLPGKLYFRFKRAARKPVWNPGRQMSLERGA